jgi:Na+(H+)/acetate symporter ActP
MFNGLLKIPMQFFILLTGIMVFVFFQFTQPPAFFNQPGYDTALNTAYQDELTHLTDEHDAIFRLKRNELLTYANNPEANAKSMKNAAMLHQAQDKVRGELKETIAKAAPKVETKDTDYVFLTYIINFMPVGLIGLLLAVIFSAAMSSTAGEINALASTTVVDYYKRLVKNDASEQHYLFVSKAFTVMWGVIAIGVALSARLFDNLIQLVNLLGSLFYGTILGIFVVAFFFKNIGARAVFWAGLVAEALVIICHLLTTHKVIELGYLWYNLIGCIAVVVIALVIQMLGNENE